jgi:preprotein translocase SecE subunit
MTRLVTYIRDTAAEMHRVSWPTQKQTVVYTVLVIAVSALVAVLLSAFDYIFTHVLEYFI